MEIFGLAIAFQLNFDSHKYRYVEKLAKSIALYYDDLRQLKITKKKLFSV